MAGNIYVGGFAAASDAHAHCILCTNVGGTWSTSDDLAQSAGTRGYNAFTCDTYGNLYVGMAQGSPGHSVRWLPASQTAANSTFSNVQIVDAIATTEHYC